MFWLAGGRDVNGNRKLHTFWSDHLRLDSDVTGFRPLAVPLILAVGVLAFLLARSLYASSLAVGANLGQVFAFFALFGAISFLAKLGLSQPNKHLAALLRDPASSMIGPVRMQRKREACRMTF